MSALYTFRDAGGDVLRSSPLAKPVPVHALTPAAEKAREAVRRFAYDRQLRRDMAAIVTDVGNPPVIPYAGTRPAAATKLATLAQTHGFRVNVFETPGNVRSVVEGIRGTVAFRAVWLRARAESGTWHERDWRYAMIHDERPVGVSAVSRLALAGKRGAGLAADHVAVIASPLGISVGVSEITKRVSTT